MSEIKFGRAPIGDINLHYAAAGDGEKLVVLLHGFPEFWYSWRRQIEALSDEYTVVAPDMRGYNFSDKPARREDYAIDKLVDDVVGLIHYFGRGQAAVVGHDWARRSPAQWRKNTRKRFGSSPRCKFRRCQCGEKIKASDSFW